MQPENTDALGSGRDPVMPDCGASESRALVALTPLLESPERATGYRSAAFLAQLVATKDQHPQTRGRRRAEPNVASAAYRATAALTAA
jgi:hypothetical protein